MASVRASELVFGIAGPKYLNDVESVATALAGTSASFRDTDAFVAILRRDVSLGAREYWLELISRAHLVAALSLLRAYRWLDATLAAVDSRNYLQFSAALRGLFEATADTYYSLNGAAPVFAENFHHLSETLAGRATELLTAPELESLLIHFTHARRKPRNEDLPADQIAKYTIEYIRNLQGPDEGPLTNLYGELCESTHPASGSIDFLIDSFKDEAGTVTWTIGSDKDLPAIEELCRRYSWTLPILLSYAFDLSLLTLKTVSHFDLPSSRTDAVAQLSLSHVPEWRELSSQMQSPAAEDVFRDGQDLHCSGLADDAAAAYQLAIEVDPQHDAALVGLGRLKLEDGAEEAALELAEQVLSANPDSTDGLALKADALVALNRINEARTVLASSIELHPASPELRLKHLFAALQSGVREPARDEARRLLRLLWGIEDQRKLLDVAEFAYQLDLEDEVLPLACRLVETFEAIEDPGLEDKHGLARACLLAGDSSRCRQISERLVEEDPACTEYWVLLAKATRIGVGGGKRSLQVLRRAVGINPMATDLLSHLAKEYVIGGKTSKGLECAKRALEIDPTCLLARHVVERIEGREL